jgi:hypothetical protein
MRKLHFLIQRLHKKTSISETKYRVGKNLLKFTRQQALKAQAGIKGIALLFTPGKDPVPIVEEAGWASGPFWKGAANLATHRDSIPGPSSP